MSDKATLFSCNDLELSNWNQHFITRCFSFQGKTASPTGRKKNSQQEKPATSGARVKTTTVSKTIEQLSHKKKTLLLSIILVG